MIYFLYGQDTYRSKQKLEEIIERYKGVHKSGLNLRFFDCQGADFQDFASEFRQMPMFQEKKLLALKNLFQNQEFKKAFLENGKSFTDSKDIIVIREEASIPAKDSLLKFLTTNAKAQEFGMLGGVKLNNWAKKEFEKYQAKIQPEALGQLVSFVGNNLWQFSQEIQKLSAFGKNQTVGLSDIDILVKPEIETDIFQTIEALALRNKKKALWLLHEHLEKGDSPLYLLSMINFQFRNLLIAKKTGRISGHPYFAKKTLWIAERFSFDELKAMYRSLLEADIQIKTGRIDPQAAIDLFIGNI